MKRTIEHFTLNYNNKAVTVEVLSFEGRVLYSVHFNDRPSVFLAKAITLSGKSIWTSVPEGRQGIAVEIGALIDEYLNVNKNTSRA